MSLRFLTVIVAALGLLACPGSPRPDPKTYGAHCGDQKVHSTEGCDDGNRQAGDGCSGQCQVEPGWSCAHSPSRCVEVCGDGTAVGRENCDDGNGRSRDGCDSACRVERGWDCRGEPTVCEEVCGDRLRVGTEQCDDANTTAGDGCDSCRLENRVLEPILVAGFSGSRDATGAIGHVSSALVDQAGFVIAGDDASGYEQLHLYGTSAVTLEQPVAPAVVDFGATSGAGDGPLQFLGISALAVCRTDQNLLVLERGNARVQVLAPTAAFPHYRYVTAFGSAAVDPEAPGEGEFIRPGGLACDSLGRVFVADSRGEVQVFSGDNVYLTRFGKDGLPQGHLGQPGALALDEVNNRIYVCDEQSDDIVVYVYRDHTFVRRFAGFAGTPVAVTVDAFGHIYVLDRDDAGTSFVRILEPDNFGEVFRFTGDTSNTWVQPSSLSLNRAQDLLLVGDAGNHRVLGYSLSHIQSLAQIRRLKLYGPKRAMAGKTVTLRAELHGPYGQLDWAGFRSELALTAQDPAGQSIPLPVDSLQLHNGMGSATLRVAGGQDITLQVQADSMVAQHQLQVLSSPDLRSLSGTLAQEDLEWSAADGVIALTGDVVIPEGSTLRIGPGTLVMLDDGVRVDIHGDVLARGTREDPVAFFARNGDVGWGQIEHHIGSAQVVYHNVFFTQGGNITLRQTTTDYHNHCCTPLLRVQGGAFEFTESTVADANAKGLLVVDAQVVIKNSLFNRLGMGAELVHGDVVVEDSVFATFRGTMDNDGIYMWARARPGDFDLRRVVLADGDDDAIDTADSSPQLRDTLIYGWVDKGLGLTGGGLSCTNCLIFDTEIGCRTNDIELLRTVTTSLFNTTMLHQLEYGLYVDSWSPQSVLRPLLERVVIWDSPQSVRTDFEPDLTTIRYCNLQHPMVGAAGTGNISQQPLFMDSTEFDFRLHPLSPGYVLEGVDGAIGWLGWD